MKRYTPQLDGLPLPLRCLSAYSVLCAVLLAVLGLAEFAHDPSAWSATRSSWSMPIEAVGLFAVAHLLTVPERWAWAGLVAVTVGGLTVSLVFDTTGFVLGITALVVLLLPSSRTFAGVTAPTASRF
jgi:hypothetical protein